MSTPDPDNRVEAPPFVSDGTPALLLDPDSKEVLDANPEASRLLGYSIEDLVGRQVDEMHPDEGELLASTWDQLNVGASVLSNQLHCQTADGERIPVVLALHRVRVGQRDCVLSEIRDQRGQSTESDVAQHVVRATARSSGDHFFRQLVRSLAEGLGMETAFVARCRRGRQAEMLAFWDQGDWQPPVTYDTEGGPCSHVLTGGTCYYPSRLRTLFSYAFPRESYLGVPITSDDDRVIGHLVVGDSRSLPALPPHLSLLSLLADRCAAELRQMRTLEGLVRSQERYRFLFDSLPVMAHATDSDGRIAEVSPYWLARLGYSRAEVVGHLATDFLTESSRRFADRVCMPRYLSDGRLDAEPLQFQTRDGMEVDVLLSARSRRKSDGSIGQSVVVSVEIGEHLRDRHRLQACESMLSAVLKVGPSALVIVRLSDGQIIDCNQAFERLTGLGRTELLGNDAVSLGLWSRDALGLSVESAQRSPLREVKSFHITVPPGRTIRTRLSVEPFGINEDPHVVLTLSPTTDQVAAARMAVDAADRERKLVAGDLHDGLGPTMSGIRFRLAGLIKALEKEGSGTTDDAREVERLFGHVLTEIRRIGISEATSELGSDLLPQALRELAADYEKIHADDGLTVEVRIGQFPPLQPPIPGQLLRIAQEAMTNAVRHGRAGQIEVRLLNDGGRVCLDIADNGSGMPETTSSGLGIAMMRHRAAVLGGTLSVTSNEQGGVTVSCVLP
ncbi:MAG: PAS domain S-box protein [Rhodothermales bacterium]|nr:PAS domain S-box protein [Rhodothermales bacterium]MBO6778454.1 PAS domain S-box protein [Rhodothermales bacterium]